MSSPLMPCPFCGGECDPKGWMGQDKDGATTRGPECETCGATAMSVEVWNQRFTQPDAGEPVAWMRSSGNDVMTAKQKADCQQHNGLPGKRIAEDFSVPLYAAPPAVAHGDEAVRKDATESAIQRACDVLPEDWTMQIDLERGAGCVTLFNPWGSVVDFGQDFESIGAEVEAAIAAAMRAQAGEGGEV